MNPTDLQAYFFRALTLGNVAKTLNKDDRNPSSELNPELMNRFSLPIRLNANEMAKVYVLLFCFENSVRDVVESILKETYDLNTWWNNGVPEPIRISAEKNKAKEQKARWHGARGGSMLNFVDFPQLGDIILDQWVHFEDLLGETEWVTNMFREFNVSRRVLAHTGVLSAEDIDRIEYKAKEWLRVVG